MSDDKSDALVYQFLGRELSLRDMAESASAMLEDDVAAEGDPTACDHKIGLPYEDGYACGTCHAELPLGDFEEVWINLDNAVVKIDFGFQLGELFE